MSDIPEGLRYTPDHEWARLEPDGRVRVGITDFAQEQLGDVVYLDLPSIDSTTEAAAPMGEIESTKSVSDLVAPVTGVVVEVNEKAREDPVTVNQEPYGSGWLVILTPSDSAQFDALLTSAEYRELLSREAGE